MFMVVNAQLLPTTAGYGMNQASDMHTVRLPTTMQLA